MPLADWTVPFDLTSQVYSSVLLPINQSAAAIFGEPAYYFLRPDGCSLVNTVRQTKDNVPQSNGSILHRRWVQGLEMTLAIQLWKDADTIACDGLEQEMLDTLMGYAYGLLNAIDNQGRIQWNPGNGNEERMLDNLRLLSFPAETRSAGTPLEITFTLDTQYPYQEALTQRLVNLPNTVPVVINNTGNVPTYPVIQVNRVNGVTNATPVSGTIIIQTATEDFFWTSSLTGSQLIPGSSYAEIDMFGNTMYMNGNGANLSPGIDFINSQFFPLMPGVNTVTMFGGTADVLWNPAWA
jgi:hypothetical protein